MTKEFVILLRWLVKACGVMCWLFVTGWTTGSQSRGPCCEPLWTTQLAKSYESPNLGERLTNKTLLHHHENAGVAFLDSARLIAYGVESTGQLSSRANTDVSSAFRLHAVLFDASSGKLAFTKDWGTRPRGSSIQVTEGGVLIRVGDQMKFCSKSLEELHRSDLRDTGSSDSWAIRVSPTGKTIMVSHSDRYERYFEVRDGQTFEVKRSWSDTPPFRHNLYSVSDGAIAAADLNQERILLSDFGSKRWEALKVRFKIGCVGSPTFVSETLLINASCKKLSLLSTTGETLMEESFEKNESVDGQEATVAKSARIIAVSLERGKGGGIFDTDVRRTGNRIALYDLVLRKRVLTVDVVPMPTREYDFALSPDGSKLAILNDRNVSVYSVPVQSPEHTETVNPKDETLHVQIPVPQVRAKQ